MTNDEPHFWVFADGSCGPGSNAIGAWATYVHGHTQRKILYGLAHPATISRCELIPLIEGLRWIKGHVAKRTTGIRVRVYSDSEYTIKTLSGGYPTSKNLDLWKSMEVIQQGFCVEWIYRERNSHYYMVLCDALCSKLRKEGITAIHRIMGDSADITALESILPPQPPPTEKNDVLLDGLSDIAHIENTDTVTLH